MRDTGAVNHRLRDRSNGTMPWLWFSCLALLLLLPPVSFAQSHLWQYRPFRANDTDHSGGDHICDLRSDSNADGKPDRLGDYVGLVGSVIVEPATFDPGGRLFWIREGGCGIMVYGEPEDLRLGDSVRVWGRLRAAQGQLPPEMDLAAGDIALEKARTAVRCGTGDQCPLYVTPEDYVSGPAGYGGNLIRLTRPIRIARTRWSGAGLFARATCGGDSLIIYVDGDIPCTMASGRCYRLTGVVVITEIPSGLATSTAWCIAPRNPEDAEEVGCSPACGRLSWGRLKTQFQR